MANSILHLFNECFAVAENTVLIAGAGEPLYLPATHDDNLSGRHEVHFAHGFANSALHEIAHWCIAGFERRQLLDYGYWYAPDGRTPEQQALFEKVEVKPQALEWILAEACGLRFHISFDNLEGAGGNNAKVFKEAVWKQALSYYHQGLPSRAEVLKRRFLEFFERTAEFGEFCFVPSAL